MTYGAKKTGNGFDPVATDQQILALWCAGRDTHDIARLTGVPESEVANRLPRIVESRRQPNAFEISSSETKEPFRTQPLPPA